MSKIKRSSLPFKFLNELEQEAQREFKTLLERGMAVIEAELRNALPGDDELALSGTLQKSVGESIAVREMAAHFRRIIHKAPLNLDQLNEDTIQAVIDSLPWDGGTLYIANITKNGVGDPLSTEEAIPLSRIRLKSVRADKLKAVLKGKKEKIRLIWSADQEYLIQEGEATVLAAKIVGLPGVLAIIDHFDELKVGLPDSGHEEIDIIILAKPIVRLEVYKVPSYLEPIAEICRRYSYEECSYLNEGLISPQEKEQAGKADQRDRERILLWRELYGAARHNGLTEAQANREVREDPKWRRMEELSEKQFELSSMIDDRWGKMRDEWRSARELMSIYKKQDGLEKEELDLQELYSEAQKGSPSKNNHSYGDPSWAYTVGERVEVMDATGAWHSGLVLRTADGFVRVRRDDNQYRVIEDPITIRREGEGNLLLDKSSEMEYNRDMTEIRIPEFKVLIPAGSNSAKIEHGLTPVTEEMNRTGLKVNSGTWERNRDKVALELERLTAECHKIAGREFRPNSPKDCEEIFIIDLGFAPQRVSRTSGKPSIDKDTLQSWQATGSELAGKVIDAREAQSRLSQLEKWEPFAQAGRVQCKWNQQGTPMARYSCDSPNLQNRIVEIRETIEADEGYKFISNDLGQAEYVTWASLSGDPTLSQSFKDGTDFHLKMYDEVMIAAPGIDLHDEPRQAGKTINFALLYLMQPFVLSKKLGITTAEAQVLVGAYRERAPVAVQYMEDYLKDCQKTGMTSTKFGRTRFMPELKTAKGPALHQARKTAWHHRISGTAAEVMKLKQVKSWRRLNQAMPGEYTCALQMHDEVIFMVKDERVEEAKVITMEAMEKPIAGMIPFRIDQRTGNNWLEISK